MSMGSLFGVFAGFYYWIGKMSGRQYPEWAGQVHFWLLMIGVNVTFFPQHFLGLQGMPRRYVDYPEVFAGWNHISSIGAAITAVATVWFIGVALYTVTRGKKVGANYWGEGADTLEWTVPSPPEFHTFEHTGLPVLEADKHGH